MKRYSSFRVVGMRMLPSAAWQLLRRPDSSLRRRAGGRVRGRAGEWAGGRGHRMANTNAEASVPGPGWEAAAAEVLLPCIDSALP